LFVWVAVWVAFEAKRGRIIDALAAGRLS